MTSLTQNLNTISPIDNNISSGETENISTPTPSVLRPTLFQIPEYTPQDIYVDVSNVYSSMKHNLGAFLRAIEDGKLLNRRIAFGSKTTIEICEWERQFQSFGYQTRCEIRPTDDFESMVDDCLAAHIYRVTLRQTEKVRIIIVSGDGNQKNSTTVSIYDSILLALMYGLSVTVWGWNNITSNNYKILVTRFPTLFALKFLDDILQLTVTPRVQLKMNLPILKASEKGHSFPNIKVMTKDRAPFPEATKEQNFKILSPLFTPYVCVRVSKSPVGSTPYVVFAYFSNEESLDAAFEIAKTHPFLVLNGNYQELEFEKCALPGTGIKKNLNENSPDDHPTSIPITETTEEDVLPMQDISSVEVEKVQQEQQVEESQVKDKYSILVKGNKVILPEVESWLMKKYFSDNLKTIPICFSSSSIGKSLRDCVFCTFPTEEYAKLAIKHFQETHSLIINGSVYPIIVLPNPQKFEKKVSQNN